MKTYLTPIALFLALLFLFIYQPSLPFLQQDAVLVEGEGVVEEEEEEDKMARENGYFEMEFEMTRDPKTNTVPRERLLHAERMARIKLASPSHRALPIQWEERGPDNEGGRTRALLFDANDPSYETVFAGSVSGGLWKTTNISADDPQWQPVNEFFSVLSISYLVQDPTNPSILYFGTGEGYGNGDSASGMGIWKSTDGGDNWVHLANTNTTEMRTSTKMAINAQGQVFFCGRRGAWRSTDGGANWTKILTPSSGSTIGTDIELTADGTLFIAMGTSNDGIQRSRDNGDTWTRVGHNGGGLPDDGFNRTEIISAPSAPNVIYAFLTENDRSLKGFYRSEDGGDTWTLRSSSPNICGTQCWYNMALAVDPNNPDRIFAGGIGMYESEDGAVTWEGVIGLHVDHHMMLYQPGSSEVLLFGNDGGVYRATDASADRPRPVDKNKGYNTVQYYAAALGPGREVQQFIGGTQDNGTHQFLLPGLNPVDRVVGGDGGYCHIDQDNPQIQIGSYQRNNHYVTNNAWSGGTRFFTVSGGYFISPSDYDSDDNTLYISTSSNNYAYVTEIGQRDDYLPVYVDLNDYNITGTGRATHFKISPSVAHRVYIGFSGGSIVQVDNAHTSNPTIRQLADLNIFLSCIDVDLNDENHMLATSSSYGTISVWESFDGGQNWTEVEGDLPDMPVRWVMFSPKNPDQALLATELGIWTTENLDGSNTIWQPSSSGLANVRVTQLHYRQEDGFLLASTYGRGMYTTDYFAFKDTDPPIPTLSSVKTIYPGPFTVNINFNEKVRGFELSDLVVTNGTAGNLQTINAQRRYTVDITPLANGLVTLQIPAGKVVDETDKDNIASNLLEITIDPDADKSDLELTLTVDNTALQVFQNRTYTLTVHNRGGITAEDVVIDFPLPNGVAYVDQNLSDFEYSNWTGLWNVDEISSRTSKTLELTVFTLLVSGDITSYAQVLESATPDKDSSPGNGICCTPVEDDEAAVTLGSTDVTPPSVTLSSSSSTVNGPFSINIDFSEAVSGLNASDFNITNGSAQSLNKIGSTSYTLAVMPGNSGEVSLQLPAGSTSDIAGNGNTISNLLTLTIQSIDVTPPSVTLSSNSTTVNGPFNINVEFSEAVSGLSASDFNITNGNAIALNPLSTSSYTLAVTPGSNGEVSIQLPANTASDAAGNGNTISNLLTLTIQLIDNTPPSVTLSSSTTTVSGPFNINVEFSEAVSGLTAGDFNITNGSATALSTLSTSSYTLAVTPGSNGSVSIQLPAYTASDAAGNGNTISNLLTLTIQPVDVTPPSVSLSSTATTVNGPFDINVEFSEAVSGLALSDFEVSNGNATLLTMISNSSYTLAVTPGNSGQVSIQLPADAANDDAGNGNTASNLLTLTIQPVDDTPPSVTLSTPRDTVNGPFDVSLLFSEAVSGLTTNDLISSNASLSNLQTLNGQTSSLLVSPQAPGIVTLQLPANSVADDAGNGNTASNLLEVFYQSISGGDKTDLQLSLSLDNTALTIYQNRTYTLALSNTSAVPAENILVNFPSPADMAYVSQTVSEGLYFNWTGEWRINSLGAGQSATLELTLFTLRGTGNIVAYAQVESASPEDVDSTPGNGSCCIPTEDDEASVILGDGPDTIRPTVSMSTPSNSVRGPFPVDITFSEVVTGLSLDDFTIINGTLSGLSGTGANYSLTVTPVSAGLVSLGLPENKVSDAVGNGNLRATTLSVNFQPTTDVCINENPDFIEGFTGWNNFGNTEQISSPTDCCALQIGPEEGGFGQAETFLITSDDIITIKAFAAIQVGVEWAGFGVRYLDAAGEELGEDRTELTIGGYMEYELISRPPAGATQGYLWAYKFGDEKRFLLDKFCVNTVQGIQAPPSVQLSTAADTVSGPFTVTVQFNEAVSDLTGADFTLDNATAGAISRTSNSSFSLVVNPTTAGAVRVKLDKDKTVNTASLGNNASNFLLVNYQPISGDGVDLEMSVTSTSAGFGIYQNVTYVIAISNRGTRTAESATVALKKPSDLAYVSQTVTAGVYDDWVAKWDLVDLLPGATETVELTLFTLQNNRPMTLFAQVIAQTPSDLDSSPDNNSGIVPQEDDEAAITLSPSSNIRVDQQSSPLQAETSVHIHQLYPNPAVDVLRIRLLSDSRRKQALEVYSAEGQLVRKVWIALDAGINEYVLEVSDLSAGMYYLLLEGSTRRKKQTLQRFIKQRY
ncbi:MAG: Ig-like domain-containing protein [Bacteroidota bacterium]